MLGCAPAFVSYAHISPLTLNFYYGGLDLCFHIPQCELGLSALSPAQRRHAVMTSSLTHRCFYCVGHVCVMGDAIRGSQFQQLDRAGGWERYKKEMKPIEHSDIIQELVREACAFPGHITDETRGKFLTALGEKAYDEITGLVAFMGWLNYEMDAFGMRLESEAMPVAQLLLTEEHEQVTEKLEDIVAHDGNEKKGKDALTRLKKHAPDGPLRRGWGCVQMIFGFVMLLPSVLTLKIKQAGWFQGIPGNSKAVNQWMFSRFGTVPGFMGNVNDVGLKKVIAFGCKQAFLRKESSWTMDEKLIMLYVFARKIGNAELHRDAQNLVQSLPAKKATELLASLNEDEKMKLMDKLYKKVTTEAHVDTAFEAALRFMTECAGAAGSLSQEATADVIRLVEDPRARVDITGIVAFSGFLHRITVFRRGMNLAT